MAELALPVKRSFEPRDPDWESQVRASFARQKVMALIGARLTELRPGNCEIRLPFRDDLSQQTGYFHAGIIATVVDSAGGYAGFTLMPAGSDVLSVEFKLNLMSPADGELLIATGEVLKSGKNLVIARGEVYVAKSGRITHCATMQQTLMTMQGKNSERN
jgi:uncharacterized protein (TIGR00369 family)